MKGIVSKIILFCFWASLLISLNYIESISEAMYEGPYSLGAYYIGFAYDEDQNNELYTKLDKIDGPKLMMSFENDTLFLKCDRMLFNQIQVTNGTEISGLDYYKEKPLAIFNEEISSSEDIVIKGVSYSGVGEFVALDGSFNQFKTIATLNNKIGLSKYNLMDFVDRSKLNEAKAILENNAIEYETASIPLSLMVKRIQYLNQWQVSLFLGMISFVITTFIIQYFDMTSERKEVRNLLIMGVPKSKIAYKKILVYALISATMMIVSFVFYYLSINPIINTDTDLLFELSLAAIILVLQVVVYGLNLLFCWRKING